jgi:RNA polymerase sigma-70 factor (ECF subfamily)
MINKLIDELPTKTKQVFTMSKVRGLSNSEISIKLQIHPKTVEGHITKAFKLLRNNALQPA